MDTFIVENEKTARRFLKAMEIRTPQAELTLFLFNKYTRDTDPDQYLQVTEQGKDIGILSEAGCPAVADPGAVIVRRAHEKGIRVVPFVGPSAILLGLMASGFNGQRFAFHGYLPVNRPDRIKKLQELERESEKLNQTQIFMETPYRNHQLLAAVLKACRPDTGLSISCDLTLESEYISARPVAAWKTGVPDLHKRPAVFLIYRKPGP